MENVIVTGANGFIGRNFITHILEKGIRVIGVYRDESRYLKIENKRLINITCPMEKIGSLPELINEEADVFYHFAWDGSTGSGRADYKKQLDNVRFSLDAANCAKALQCRKFIATGTITEKIIPQSIVQQYSSQNLMYAVAKDATHHLLDIECKRIGIPYCWVQLANTFGGDNRNGNLISYTLEELQKGKIPEYGPGNQPIDFSYIRDTVEGLFLVGSRKATCHEYFLGSGKPRLLREYLKSIEQIMNVRLGIGKRPDDGVLYKKEWFDNSNMQDDFGFWPKYSFEDALREIILS